MAGRPRQRPMRKDRVNESSITASTIQLRSLFDEGERHIHQVQDFGGHGTEQQAFENTPAMKCP